MKLLHLISLVLLLTFNLSYSAEHFKIEETTTKALSSTEEIKKIRDANLNSIIAGRKILFELFINPIIFPTKKVKEYTYTQLIDAFSALLYEKSKFIPIPANQLLIDEKPHNYQKFISMEYDILSRLNALTLNTIVSSQKYIIVTKLAIQLSHFEKDSDNISKFHEYISNHYNKLMKNNLNKEPHIYNNLIDLIHNTSSSLYNKSTDIHEYAICGRSYIKPGIPEEPEQTSKKCYIRMEMPQNLKLFPRFDTIRKFSIYVSGLKQNNYEDIFDYLPPRIEDLTLDAAMYIFNFNHDYLDYIITQLYKLSNLKKLTLAFKKITLGKPTSLNNTLPIETLTLDDWRPADDKSCENLLSYLHLMPNLKNLIIKGWKKSKLKPIDMTPIISIMNNLNTLKLQDLIIPLSNLKLIASKSIHKLTLHSMSFKLPKEHKLDDIATNFLTPTRESLIIKDVHIIPYGSTSTLDQPFKPLLMYSHLYISEELLKQIVPNDKLSLLYLDLQKFDTTFINIIKTHIPNLETLIVNLYCKYHSNTTPNDIINNIKELLDNNKTLKYFCLEFIPEDEDTWMVSSKYNKRLIDFSKNITKYEGISILELRARNGCIDTTNILINENAADNLKEIKSKSNILFYKTTDDIKFFSEKIKKLAE